MVMIKRNITRAGELWQIVDRQLGQTRWLAGDDFTMGDVPLGILPTPGWSCRLAKVGLEHCRPKLANVWRWYDQLQAMQNYRDIVAIGLT